MALVPLAEVEKTQELAEKIRKTIDEHMFEVQKKTVHVTVSVGGALIDENVPAGQDALSHASDAAVKVRQKNGAGNGVLVVKPADPARLIASWRCCSAVNSRGARDARFRFNSFNPLLE